MTAFRVLIPARLQSSRLPGKLLKTIAGKSVIQYVYEQALRSGALSVVIAIDDERIAELAQSFGAAVCFTDPEHQSGSDRIAQAVKELDYADDDIIVNVQGDEPLIPPEIIRQVAVNLEASQSSMATLCWPIHTVEEWHNPNVVKVVRDKSNTALYFSRAAIPYQRDTIPAQEQRPIGAYRHVGIYAYRVDFLQQYVSWPIAVLEQQECLEQLRVLANGHSIHVADALTAPPQDINTQADLDRLRQLLETQAEKIIVT